MRELILALRESQARTDPGAVDPRLIGRTYAIPFEDVWNAARRVAEQELRGWTVSSADDLAGLILATSKTRLFDIRDDVRIEIGLDENAQTRVDVISTSRTERPSLGRNRRAIARFLETLDGTLAARPDQILDATSLPAWLERH